MEPKITKLKITVNDHTIEKSFKEPIELDIISEIGNMYVDAIIELYYSEEDDTPINFEYTDENGGKLINVVRL